MFSSCKSGITLFVLRLKSCPSSLKNFRTFVLAWFPIFCKIIVNVKVDFELQLFNPRGSNHSIDAFHSRLHKGWTLIIIGDDWRSQPQRIFLKRGNIFCTFVSSPTFCLNCQIFQHICHWKTTGLHKFKYLSFVLLQLQWTFLIPKAALLIW